jgi:PAS domain S-box-containing protein
MSIIRKCGKTHLERSDKVNGQECFIVENSPSAICFGEIKINKSGKINDFIYDYINPKYASLTGLNPGEIGGKSIRKLFEKKDYTQIFMTVQCFSDEGTDTHEIYFDRIAKHLRVTYKMMDKRRICAWMDDITTEKLLTKIEKKYNAIINYSNDAIYLNRFDTDGTLGCFEEVNQKACEELGYSHEEMLKLKPWEIDFEPDLDEKKAIIKALMDNRTVRFEGKHQRKDGSVFPVEVNSGLMTSDGTMRTISVARNIEDRKKYENTLKLHKKLLAMISDSITLISRDMTLVIVNDAFAGYFNTIPEALEGKKLEELLGHNAFETKVRPYVAKALNGEWVQYETWFRDADNKRRYMSIKCQPYKDEEGHITGCMNHGREMTLEKQMKDEILRNHELLYKIIDTLPGTTTLINRNYEILLTGNKNEKIRLTGLPSTKDLIGKKCYEIFQKREEPCPWCSAQRVFETGESFFEQTTPEDPREKLMGQAYQIYYAPVRDENGVVTACLEYILNVTDYRESQLKTEEALRNKTEALSTISHEIRNQLGGIIAFSELIQREGFNSETGDHLERIITSGKQLMAILEDTLAMSKFESGNLQLDLQETDLKKLIKKITDNMTLHVLGKGNHISLEIPETLSQVRADTIRLNQILINLLSNANKFTENGEILIKLEITEETPETMTILFSVSDTGIGIPKEFQKNIFNAYDQGIVKTGDAYGGTGIGLTISNKLLALMNSTLTLESEAGRGSTFSFKVCFQKVLNKIKTENRRLQSVLIADDHDISRVLAETMIRMRYPETAIHLAENGEEVMQIYKTIQPDFILLDVQIPRINGLDITRKIRQLEEGQDTRTVILGYSAATSDRQVKLALDNGMNDFIKKPILKNVFYECLERQGF